VFCNLHLLVTYTPIHLLVTYSLYSDLFVGHRTAIIARQGQVPSYGVGEVEMVQLGRRTEVIWSCGDEYVDKDHHTFGHDTQRQEDEDDPLITANFANKDHQIIEIDLFTCRHLATNPQFIRAQLHTS